DQLTERLTFTNFLVSPVEFWVGLSVANDFADIFEVRGWKRAERGVFYAPRIDERSIIFAYRGRDGRLVQSALVFDVPPDELGPRAARWRFVLHPHRPHALEWHVLPDPLLGSEGNARPVYRHR